MSIKGKLTRVLSPGENLSQRVVRGGIWVFTLRIFDRSLGLIRIVILARLLAPEDFGLFGIVVLAMSTPEAFSQTGIGDAIVQKKGDIKSYLNTGWTIQIIRGAALVAILFACAPLVASFFQESKATLILQVLAASVFLNGLQNIGIVYFRKELQFHKLFIYQLSGTLADLGVAITAALLLRSVWALAFGLLARSLMICILSYVIHPYRPRLRFEFNKAKELYSFGRWIFLNHILFFLVVCGDDILAGKLLGTAALGFYQMAYRLSNMPATQVSCVISGVTFPAYSKLQDNLPRLREAYLRTLQITGFLVIPFAGAVFALAPEFTKGFLGERWMPMVPAMRVLSIYGLSRAISGTCYPLFYATKNPNIVTRIELAHLMVLAVSIYPLALKWNISGIALSVVISHTVVSALCIRKVIYVLNVRITDLARRIHAPILSGFIMLIIVWIPQQILSLSGVFGFLLLAFSGSIAYLGSSYLFERYSVYRILSVFTN